MPYRNYEDATVRNNIRKARARHAQLKQLLNGKSSLTLKAPLRLWKACLMPVVFYGLHANYCTGVTEHGACLVHVAVTKQLKAQANSPVHITRAPTTKLFARPLVRDPISFLCNLCTLHDKLTVSCLRTAHWQWLHMLNALVDCLPNYLHSQRRRLKQFFLRM